MPKKLVEKITNLPKEEELETEIDEKNDSKSDDSINDEKTQNNSLGKNKNIVRKAGRTLLIKLINDTTTFEESLLDNLTGLINKTNLTNNKTLFLTFDNNNNSLNALKILRSKSFNKYHVKFSYYKLFFTINGLTDKSDYNESKKGLIDLITNNNDIQVLYCKFYCKENKYLGCGDLTVDKLEDMNKLLSKNDGFKEFTFKTISGVFYRFNKKKDEN